MSFNLSVIIPLSSLVRSSVDCRLKSVLHAVSVFYKGCEIICVEQSLDGKYYYLPHLPKTVKKIKLEYPVFNKGWCINVGVKAASNSHIIIAESDMVGKPYWDSFCRYVTKKGWLWCFAWNKLLYTTKEQRELYLTKNKIPYGKTTSPQPGYSEGGLVYFYKRFFNKIGMCNECFQELGGIDNEIITRARSVKPQYNMYPAQVLHLWHPQTKKSKRPTRLENIKMCRATSKSPQTVINWLRNQTQGQLDKPLIARKEFML